MAGNASPSMMVAIVKQIVFEEGCSKTAVDKARRFTKQFPKLATAWELRELCCICRHEEAKKAGDAHRQKRLEIMADACYSRFLALS